MQPSFRPSRVLALLLAFTLTVPSFAQNAAPPAKSTDKAADEDPLKRKVSDEQRKKNEKAFRKEVGKEYRDWLESDVRWIITDEERNAFKQLSNDEERDQFIEGFWLRRDPTPDTLENEYKEEHYRRIAYANERFAAGIPGWKTDRGQIYIKFGEPTQIDSHPSGGQYQRPIEEGGGQTSTYPFEVWRYRYLEGTDLGNEVEIEFVDRCMCGEYRMTIDRSEKDAMLYVPGAGATLYEAMGMASKADRFTGNGFERLGKGPVSGGNTDPKMFERLSRFAALSKAPPVKFADLEEVVRTKVRYNLMPFEVRWDFIRVTDDTVLVPITVQIKNRDITADVKDGIVHRRVNIFGRLTTLSNRIAQTFEETVSVDVPQELLERSNSQSAVFWKAFPLKSGRYELNVVVKDVGSSDGRIGTYEVGVQVPQMREEDGIMASTLIVADQMEKVPLGKIGSGNFVIGDTKVRPKLANGGQPATFKRSQKANFWMQVYNLGVDEKNKSNATIEYSLINTADNKALLTTKEESGQIGAGTGKQITLAKSLPLGRLQPGIYEFVIKVNDNLGKQTLKPQTVKFAVEN